MKCAAADAKFESNSIEIGVRCDHHGVVEIGFGGEPVDECHGKWPCWLIDIRHEFQSTKRSAKRRRASTP